MELRNRAKRQGQSAVASDRRVKPKLTRSATSCTPCDPGQLRMEEAHLNLSLGVGGSGETTASTGGKFQRWSTAEVDFLLSQFGKIGWVSTRNFCQTVGQLMTDEFKVAFSEERVERKVRHIMDSFAKIGQPSYETMDNKMKELLEKYSEAIRPVYNKLRPSSASTQSASTSASSRKKNKEPWTADTIVSYMYKKQGYKQKVVELGEIIIALRDEELGPAYLMMVNLAESITDAEAVLKQLVVEVKKKKLALAAAAAAAADAL